MRTFERIEKMNQDDKLIDKNDYETIEKIAEKYSLTIQDLGKILANKKKTFLRLQIKLTDDELAAIDRSAASLGLTRSKYCTLCYKRALDFKLYEEIDVLDSETMSKKGKSIRKNVVAISFDNPIEYKKLKEISCKMGIPFSCMMRHFALKIELK